ncbi:putative pteridine-dependent deoxygenase like protein [Pseudoxanthomonas suwonensis 11-1]|uniref:Putative pteridine-dependent deoxygenase like protein n=1 Tax=Pseudoxanthomonas suwonensis (strain 11-1) TaxID=743721 RepID=E6WWS4_PSEUU|nr:putative pteridine-dependent deoxygenase like protein [Pseudoxanthomonas suwonensis 11-1]
MSRPLPLPGSDARLHVGYAPAPTLQAQLDDPRVLAVFGFGADAPGHADPRFLRVPLRPLQDEAVVEVWRTAGPVEHGRDGDVAWASDGRLLFGAMEVAEPDGGDIEAAARHAYTRIGAFLAGLPACHLLRVWNYMDAITLGEDDEERYRRFCVGRVSGLGQLDAARLPAATAIGRCDGQRVLQVYWLAATGPGTPLENPRQISAYRYPRQYGPQPPSFARAMLPPTGSDMPLLLSGTAAIVGHASQHAGSIRAQVEETLANIGVLIGSARRIRPSLPVAPDAATPLKAYVRHPEDAAEVAAALDSHLGRQVPRLLLHAQVCRRELLVEIDGAHGVPQV